MGKYFLNLKVRIKRKLEDGKFIGGYGKFIEIKIKKI